MDTNKQPFMKRNIRSNQKKKQSLDELNLKNK